MRIVIIGAGIGGLAAAHDLVQAGHDVVVYEAASQVGGLASGFKESHWDWSVEKFYHHWFASDRHLLGLAGELGLAGKVIFRRPTTVMYHGGRFYPFDSPLAALRFPGLGWGLDKVRFGLVGLYLRRTRTWQPLERVTVEQWMRRWTGDRVWERMWEPMVVGKFGERFAPLVNMAWMWARLHARTASLGTYEGGFQAFVDQTAEILRGRGVRIVLGARVEGIRQRVEGGLDVQVAGGGAQAGSFDRCLATTSPALLARLAPELPGDYLQGLLGMQSLGAVVMVLALRQPLSPEGYYWYNLPKTAGFPFLALVEHTNFVPRERFGGDVVVYCGDYLETDHEYFQLGQDEMLARFLPALQRVNPAFEPGWVKGSWLHRATYAQPVPLINHSRNIPAVATPLPGLFFASMSQVYPWDRGTNFAVEIGRRAAGMMLR
ncbi:MAG TPA: NAD(P)/FAD-dependent oxidoreductase [Thermoanaerobaculaceae bacterium]|nr:NAD(P)/FAD-dependent oxidoreductase [Thermoanaerobaculaceae bacterium]HPS79652.1 NAD(P)/FAD-dependent oxidoreductase [Thermoanaerobaculaceae bacterium]